MRRIRVWLLAALTLAGATAVSPAQPRSDGESPPGGYSADQLAAALQKLGYDVKLFDNDSFEIPVRRKGTLLSIRLSLSKDHVNLWLMSTLCVLPAGDRAAPEALRRLLKENDAIGPARFSIHEANQTLRLQRPIGNRDMSAARLRQEIDAFAELARRTEPLWRRDNFVRLGAVPAELRAGELERLQGHWQVTRMWNLDAEVPEDSLQKAKPLVRIDRDRISIATAGKTMNATIAVDPRGERGRIDFIENGRLTPGLYQLDGHDLTLVFAATPGGDRPAGLDVKPGEQMLKFTLRRAAAP